MKIKVEVNSKELDVLLKGDSKSKIKFEYEVDLYTEGRAPNKQEENVILGAIFWALMTLLPHGLVKQYFLHWNKVVEELHSKFKKDD